MNEEKKYKKQCIEYLKKIFDSNRNYIKQYELLSCQGLIITESTNENFKRIVELNNNNIIVLAHKVHYRILFDNENIPDDYLCFTDKFNINSKI